MKAVLIKKTFFVCLLLLSTQLLHAEIAFEQLPMYAHVNKNNSNDNAEYEPGLFDKAIRTFGTQKHASEGYTEKGFDHYSNNEFNKSMKRFNQAWLLNPENPYPYLGFGLLMRANNQYCDAYKMFKLANEKGLKENGFLADYAYTASQCAIKNNEALTLFEVSNDLHSQAIETPNKRLQAYVYHSWAKSYFLQKNIDKTNEMIDASISLGGKIDPSLLENIKNYKN